MKVLVTGGTGFIGSTLVRHLLAAGYEVRVLVRQRKDSFLLENLDVEIAEGSLTHASSVERAVQGCSVVFNLASLYTFYPFWTKDPKAIYRINVQGTINLLEASLKCGVKRFIHTSTIAALGARFGRKPSNEETPFRELGASHYARSKYLAEQEVFRFCQKGLPAVILNPAVVIGERDHKPTPSGDVIVKFLNRQYPCYFDSLWSVADADDVAQAHIAAIERGRIGERYILANRKHYTLKQIFKLLEKITGIPAPRVRIPYLLLLALTYLDEAVSHFIFRKKPLMPTEGIKFCRMSAVYDNAKAVRELGYRPTSFIRTLEKAVAWYRKNGYVEPRGIFRIKAHGSTIVRSIMQALRMDKFTDKLDLGTLFFFGIVKALEVLRRMGVAWRTDGWRKVTRCYLRTEQSKFSLAVFALDLWSDLQGKHEPTRAAAETHCIERLARFLKEQPSFRNRLQWHMFSAEARPHEFTDIVVAEYGEKGDWQRLTPYLEKMEEDILSENLPPDVRKRLHEAILQVYNETRHRADKERPRIFQRTWRRRMEAMIPEIPATWRFASEHYGARILSAVFVVLEPLPEQRSARFAAPSFRRYKYPGFSGLGLVCRLSGTFDETDLWFQFYHIPIDGVPAQEVLNKLKREWGTRASFLFPAPDSSVFPVPELCSTPSGKIADGTFHVHRFFDFQPFLEVRNRLNQRFGRRAHQVISSAALLIWKLAQYPEFEDTKFSIPVDLRATSSRERTLGFVFIRPSSFLDSHRPDRGFFKFQHEFNRQLFATRKRRSESYRLLEAYAVGAPCLYAVTAKVLAAPLREFVGTLGITIIKKADLFVAPASDIHTDGFIALGNFLLPGENGGRVCGVSMKGPREKVLRYMSVFEDIMHRAIQQDELYF